MFDGRSPGSWEAWTCGEFDGVVDEREGGQDVGELGFRQAVEVGDQAVQFGVEFVVGLGRFNPRRNSAGVMIGIL